MCRCKCSREYFPLPFLLPSPLPSLLPPPLYLPAFLPYLVALLLSTTSSLTPSSRSRASTTQQRKELVRLDLVLTTANYLISFLTSFFFLPPPFSLSPSPLFRCFHLSEATARFPGQGEGREPAPFPQVHCRMPENGIPRDHPTV